MPAFFIHMSCNQRHLVNFETLCCMGMRSLLWPGRHLLLDKIALAEASSDKNASPLVSVGALAAPAAPLPATVTCLVLAPGHPEGSS